MILVDSCVWIDLFRDRTTAETVRLGDYVRGGKVATGDLVVAEVLRGSSSDKRLAFHRRILMQYPLVLVCDEESAVEAARHYRHLRGLGLTVHSLVDCLLAACCLANGHRLLTSDRDFEPFVAHFGLMLA
jgi:hypothetical protein